VNVWKLYVSYDLKASTKMFIQKNNLYICIIRKEWVCPNF